MFFMDIMNWDLNKNCLFIYAFAITLMNFTNNFIELIFIKVCTPGDSDNKHNLVIFTVPAFLYFP